MNWFFWKGAIWTEYLPKEGSEFTFYDAENIGILGAEKLTVEPPRRGACREGINSIRNAFRTSSSNVVDDIFTSTENVSQRIEFTDPLFLDFRSTRLRRVQKDLLVPLYAVWLCDRKPRLRGVWANERRYGVCTNQHMNFKYLCIKEICLESS